VTISALVSSTGFKAAGLAKKYAIPMISSEAEEVIKSSEIDAIFVLTRHGSHASLTEMALRQEKHVFVEKPLAMNEEELDAVIAARQKYGGSVMVGFNRRHTPLTVKLKDHFRDRCQPMVISYRGSVGYRAPEHWLHDPVNGGGVIIGEACHFIDFCRWMVGEPITAVDSICVGGSDTSLIPEDNSVIRLAFSDGSLAVITYLSNGSTGFGREFCEVSAEGKTGVWKDFTYLKVNSNKVFSRVSRSIVPKKGFAEELDVYFRSISDDADDSDRFNEYVDSTRATIVAAQELKSGAGHE
jgi:predicted dehydrogenase